MVVLEKWKVWWVWYFLGNYRESKWFEVNKEYMYIECSIFKMFSLYCIFKLV